MKTPEFERNGARMSAEDQEDMAARVELGGLVASVIRRKGMTQVAAAACLGITQPKVSDLLKGRVAGFSMQRLLKFLVALDNNVQIVVSQKPSCSPTAAMKVHAGSVAVRPDSSGRASGRACGGIVLVPRHHLPY